VISGRTIGVYEMRQSLGTAKVAQGNDNRPLGGTVIVPMQEMDKHGQQRLIGCRRRMTTENGEQSCNGRGVQPISRPVTPRILNETAFKVCMEGATLHVAT
jgi:hypothetical protein